VKGSRPSVVLGRKIAILRRTTDLADLKWTDSDTVKGLAVSAYIVLVRSMHILITLPIDVLVEIISGVSWSIIYFHRLHCPRLRVHLIHEVRVFAGFLALAIGV
jgi:hypothetical protein